MSDCDKLNHRNPRDSEGWLSFKSLTDPAWHVKVLQVPDYK
jgi:hypothetical protein